jgi:alanine or glycine:cation symporter, AGCS family
LVALLEPFIDTIIICTLTGLVILSSGVWNQKLDTQFQNADLLILNGQLSDTNKEDVKSLNAFLHDDGNIPAFSGSLNISEGKIMNDVTVFHARSIAEDVVVKTGNDRYTGSLEIEDGKVLASENVIFEGKSLIHSAPLTAEAFTKSWMGGYGRYIVTIGLLLFAFSTAISWSYYGDRAITFLFGSGAVVYYRLVYVVGFFFAAFTDTTIIWTLSGITIAMMTIPNLIGILLLSKEMKNEVTSFWGEYNEFFSKRKK